MFHPFSINIKGKITEFERPAVMGILNVTPDSFYSGSRTPDADSIAARVEKMIADGVDIIDVGGYSSRPGADAVSCNDEMRRVEAGLRVIRKISDSIPVSVDTFRASVATEAVRNLGADIINDISGYSIDPDMFKAITELKAPYILMHLRGTPDTMQQLTDYNNVVADVAKALAEKVRELSLAGVADVIVDPGLGFAKTMEQNYRLLESLPILNEVLERPILIGLSRKSMITNLLGITADEALAPTTALNLAALERGASIIRVHDVKEGVMAVKLYEML